MIGESNDVNQLLFGENYYEHGIELGISGYSHYRWLPELTIPMAEALVKNLGIKKTDSILDFGCAKGYLVKAFRHLGYEMVYGFDVSQYAYESADDETRPFLVKGWMVEPDKLKEMFDNVFGQIDQCDWLIAKDVLEHLSEDECLSTLTQLRAGCDNIFIAVPLGNNGQFTIPEMETDITHIIRRPLWWWASLVEKAGFKVQSSAFSMPGIKENWTSKHKFGNGFIVASSTV